MKNHLKSNYHIFCETDSNSQSYISCRTIKYSRNNTNLILFKVFVVEKKNPSYCICQTIDNETIN